MSIREDRKEQIMENAIAVFAEKGYYKATTALVAKAAGVTQPYIFHFFKNKEDLFNSVIDRVCHRIYEAFSQVEAPADKLVETMGSAFTRIMQTQKDEITMVMQAHAISEPVIRAHVREKFQAIYEMVLAKFQAAGIPNAEVSASQFIGTGLLITLAEVLDLPHLVWFNAACKDE